MKNNNLISIVVPVYNVERHLNRCLDSLKNQTYKNIEIILINDGSTDTSGSICDEYAKNDSRFTVCHKDNNGVSSARNLGIKKSTGEFVLFVDSDDWVEKNTIELLVDTANENDCDFVVFEYFVDYLNGNSNQYLHPELNGKISREESIKHSILPTNRFAVTKMYRRSILNDVRFDENIHLGEDTLFVCNALNKSQKCGYFLSKSLYHYVQSETSATRNIKFNDKLLSGKDAYEKIIELCENNYPSLTKLAVSQYCEIMMAIIMEMYKEKDRCEDNIVRYSSCVRKKLFAVLFDRNCSISTKIKVILCSISPDLMYSIRSH